MRSLPLSVLTMLYLIFSLLLGYITDPDVSVCLDVLIT